MELYEQSETPSYEQTVAAYVERDYHMQIALHIDKFTHDMTKLGFNPDENIIRKEYNGYVKHQVTQALKNHEDISGSMISFEEYYQQKHQHKQNKWDKFYKALVTDDKETYYKEFSLDELEYLGY